MKHHFLCRKYTGLMFIILQTVLYGAFLTLDLAGANSSLSSKIKFSIVILCFCYALLSGRSAGKSIFYIKNDSLIPCCIRMALLFTVISDLFLLILDYYFYGVLTFIVVQQFYAISLQLSHKEKGKEKVFLFQLRRGLVRLALQLIATLIVCLSLTLLGVSMEALLAVSAFYFICILSNTLMALKTAIQNRKDKGLVLFAAGMGLFLLCDINVGLFNLSGFITLPPELGLVIYAASSILMWTFYAPSQVLIALSIRHRQK